MKILMIKEKSGYFVNPKKIKKGSPMDDDYESIENISKDDIFAIVDYALDNNVTIDDYSEGSLPNPVQATVYKSLADNILKLVASKDTMIKDVDDKFRNAEEKYTIKQ